jgi:parallel beta-helix repeat protein
MRRVLAYSTLTMQLILLALLIIIPEAGARIIYVGPNETYDNIMYGLTQADPGDTVMVRDGVYVQDIKVREGVVLMAENRHGAVIGDGSVTRSMISIRQAPVDGAVIDGFKFASGDYHSIFVGDMDAENVPSNCIIKNNLIEGRKSGIVVSPTAKNTSVTGNTIRECNGNAIIYRGYSKGVIANNTMEDCAWWGIFFTEEEWLYEPEAVLVRENTIRNNEQGGIGIERPRITMEKNLVDGNLVGIGTNSGKQDIILRDSNQIVNNITIGISLENGTSSSINSNTINGNGGHGILCRGITSLSGNLIKNNGEFGIHVTSGSAKISWNEISHNGIHGIEIGHEAINSEINNNLITDNKVNGVLTLTPVTIAGNRIERNNENGITVSESTQNVNIVDQNIISGNHWYGILLEKGASGTIRDNEIDGNRIHGIEIREDAGEVEINSNQIHDNHEMGLLTLSGCLIRENQFEDNGMHGILVGDPAAEVQITGNLITGNWDNLDDTRSSCGVWIEGSAKAEKNTIQHMNWTGIRILASATNVSLNQNKIENNRAGISVRSGSSDVLITGNIVSNNRRGVFSSGGPKLRNNTIQFNDEYGIRILNETTDLGNATEADSGMNAILNNTEWNLINETSAEIPAFCNFWGLMLAADIDSTIRDNDEDSQIGPVLFEPFLVDHGLGFPYEFLSGTLNNGRVSLRVYPNPVYQYTNIEFSLREEGRVSLVIMDNSGKMLQSLVSNKSCLSGNHRVLWDSCSESGTMVTGGVYLVVLKVNQSLYSRKILKL